MYNPPFTSDLVYSVQNEDYRSELAMLSHIGNGRSLRVLMIASAGENALSLLAQEHVASVDWFTEGFETEDFQIARAVLAELAQG